MSVIIVVNFHSVQVTGNLPAIIVTGNFKNTTNEHALHKNHFTTKTVNQQKKTIKLKNNKLYRGKINCKFIIGSIPLGIFRQ